MVPSVANLKVPVMVRVPIPFTMGDWSTLKVTVCPIAISTVLRFAGTTPPIQVVVALHSPL